MIFSLIILKLWGQESTKIIKLLKKIKNKNWIVFIKIIPLYSKNLIKKILILFNKYNINQLEIHKYKIIIIYNPYHKFKIIKIFYNNLI